MGTLAPVGPEAALLGRWGGNLWRRPFSGPVALAYEVLVAPAVLTAVRPAIDGAGLDGRLLDLGCGGGVLSAHLARRHHPVVGVDASGIQLSRLKRRTRMLESPIAPVQATALSLPFKDRAFDSALLCCSLKHWTDQLAGLREVSRSLRPGGRLMVVELDRRADAASFSTFSRATRVPPGLRWTYARFSIGTMSALTPSAEELAAHLELASFRVEQVERLAGSPLLVATAERM